MSGARERILTRVRERLGSAPEEPAPSPEPREARSGDVGEFCRRLQAAGASVERIAEDAVPQAVARYLAERNLAARVKVSPALANLGWAEEPLLETAFGVADLADAAAVMPAALGVSETGSLVHASAGDNPTTNHFLPDHAIAVVAEETVCADLEAAFSAATGPAIPRTICLITGPSRTGDIEQRIELGAHGPRSLHVLVTAPVPERGPASAT